MNVDKATRILNKMVIDKFNESSINEKEKIIHEFLSIDNHNKPISFRNKDYKEIEYFAINVNQEFKNIISSILNKHIIKIEEANKNNKIDSDVIITYINENKNIQTINGELKFGSKTDANIGLKTFDKIFTITDKNKSFLKLFQNIKEKQIDFIQTFPNNTEEEILKNLEFNINNLLKEIKTFDIIINNENLNKLLTTTGSIDKIKNDFPLLKFKINWNKSINNSIKEINDFIPSNTWEIQSIDVSENSKIRIQFIISSENNLVKFLLNWKNSYIYNGKKYKAKCGLGTSSFNVWIHRKN